MRHDFDEGKYTVTNNNGKLTALRYGEPWDRDLTGDNLIYWMLIEVDKLKQQRDELLKALKTARSMLAICAGPIPSDDERQAIEWADAAIAKVTGETS